MADYRQIANVGAFVDLHGKTPSGSEETGHLRNQLLWLSTSTRATYDQNENASTRGIQASNGALDSEWILREGQRPVLAASFLTMVSTILRSLSFRLTE